MYLYAREGLGQIPTTSQPRNLTPGSGYAVGPAPSVVEGFGQAPSLWQQIPPAHEWDRVVRAIRSLPEAKTCPAPAHAREHERRIIEKLRKQGFSAIEIQAGLNLLWRELGLLVPQGPIVGPRQMSMRPAEPGAKERGAITGAQILEERFRKAERSDDLKGMAEAAEAYYRLLGRFPPQRPGEPMPGRGRLELQHTKLLETREEILRNAPNLASIVRNLGPLELAGLRGKIGEYVRQRVLTRQQRRPRARR